MESPSWSHPLFVGATHCNRILDRLPGIVLNVPQSPIRRGYALQPSRMLGASWKVTGQVAGGITERRQKQGRQKHAAQAALPSVGMKLTEGRQRHPADGTDRGEGRGDRGRAGTASMTRCRRAGERGREAHSTGVPSAPLAFRDSLRSGLASLGTRFGRDSLRSGSAGVRATRRGIRRRPGFR
jgi:hypothetical protein